MKDIDTLINRSEEITKHLNELVNIEGRAVIALPEGFELEELERFDARRRFPRGNYNTFDFGDFMDYAAEKEKDFRDAVMFINPRDMDATIIFDYEGGRGHAKNRAYWDAQPTVLFSALKDICGRPVSQSELIDFLEYWADEVTAVDRDGKDMSIGDAVRCLSSLTVEKAKTIKQTRADWEYEQSASEKAALAKDTQMVGSLVIHDPLYVGLENVDTITAKLALVVHEDKFTLKLRLIGEEALRDHKIDEMMNRAQTGLDMPVYAGTYNPL